MSSYHICVVNLFSTGKSSAIDKMQESYVHCSTVFSFISIYRLPFWNKARSSLLENRSVLTSYCSFYLDLGPLAIVLFFSAFLSFSVIFRSCPAGFGRFVF